MAVLISRKGGGSGGGGGGSLPAWWTVDSTPGSESLTLAGELHVGTILQERIDGSTAACVPGQSTYLAWGHSFGDALLDYSDPVAPTVIEAGTYSASMTVFPDGSFGGAATSSFIYTDIELDSDNDDWDARNAAPLIIGSPITVPAVSASVTAKIPAGAVLRAQVFHDADIALGIVLRGQVVKIL